MAKPTVGSTAPSVMRAARRATAIASARRGLTTTSGSGLELSLLSSLSSRKRLAAASMASTTSSTAFFAAVRWDGRVTTRRIRQPSAVSSAMPRTLAAICLGLFCPADGQGKDGTVFDSSLREGEQVIGDLILGDDRVAPVVEPDQLRQQLGANAAAVARDAIHGQDEVPAHAANVASWGLWSANSGANVFRADCRNMTAPSG